MRSRQEKEIGFREKRQNLLTWLRSKYPTNDLETVETTLT